MKNWKKDQNDTFRKHKKTKTRLLKLNVQKRNKCKT